jgi:hypothetical protein
MGQAEGKNVEDCFRASFSAHISLTYSRPLRLERGKGTPPLALRK